MYISHSGLLTLGRSNHGTVRFPYLETCEIRKWGKAKDQEGAGYETSSCFMARDVSENYQSQIHGPQEHRRRHSHSNVGDKCFCTNSSLWVIYPPHTAHISYIPSESLVTRTEQYPLNRGIVWPQSRTGHWESDEKCIPYAVQPVV
jgi:hypothetical protein